MARRAATLPIVAPVHFTSLRISVPTESQAEAAKPCHHSPPRTGSHLRRPPFSRIPITFTAGDDGFIMMLHRPSTPFRGDKVFREVIRSAGRSPLLQASSIISSEAALTLASSSSLLIFRQRLMSIREMRRR